jgi:hypothetical protein
LIFTSSVYFSKPGRLDKFMIGFNSIPEKKMINKFIIINEFNPDDTTDYSSIMKSNYPEVIFIQKTKEQIGQARTLNMILDFIKGYDYWIHWEETWVAKRAFISEGINILNTSNVTQLQLTNDWNDLSKDRV